MSFRSIISNFWSNIQHKLFPELENQLGELSPTHKKLISILELIRIEEFVRCTRFNLGRPCEDRLMIARAFVAKIVFKFTFTKQLVDYLHKDEQLRVICGWDFINDVPSESKFSRAFKEFAEDSLPEKVHQFLIRNVYENQVVGHVIKDSTPIEVREKAIYKGCPKERKKEQDRKYRREKAGELNRRQKQLQETDLDKMISDLPNKCDKGMKTSAQGYTQMWKGYKLHAAVDDHCIPLAVIITSASLHDSEAAIPLTNKTNKVVINFYDMMDAAYDMPEIKEHSFSLGHVPIIDKCPRDKEQKIEKKAEKDRKRTLNFKTAEDKRYGERFSKERFNALYKDYHGGSKLFYRGIQKVSCHVMFGVLVVAAASIIKIMQ